MTYHDTRIIEEPQVKRRWQERLALPLLIAGGILTIFWIAALVGLAWQIASSIPGMGALG